MKVALERWSIDGIPHNPGAWITTTARHRAIDRLRRENTLARKQIVLQTLLEHEEQTGDVDMEATSIPDERLKLMFNWPSPCPRIRSPDRPHFAYTCRSSSARDCQRISCASPNYGTAPGTGDKGRRWDAGIPYRVPEAHILGERVDAVLCVLYLIFNEGHMAMTGNELIRRELCDESIRLARLLAMLLNQVFIAW